jgi:uncharacterized protein (DUF486 family)
MAVTKTILLLLISNVFMTIAWYGHLGGAHKPTNPVLAYIADLHNKPWQLAVLVSWAIAFVEYLFQVPANRVGAHAMSRAQLKIVQEVIALAVFALLAWCYWRENVGWNYLGAAACMVGAVAFIFLVGGPEDRPLEPIAAKPAPLAPTGGPVDILEKIENR